MLTKNMKMEAQTEWMDKTGFKIEKKAKYLGIIMKKYQLHVIPK